MEKADIIRRTICAFSQELFEDITRYILESMSPLSTVVLPTFRRMFDSKRSIFSIINVLEHLCTRVYLMALK